MSPMEPCASRARARVPARHNPSAAAGRGQATPAATRLLAGQFRGAASAGRGSPRGGPRRRSGRALQRAVAQQPSWTEGDWYLGTIYYDTDRHDECRDAFAHVTGQQPDNGAAWAFRGLCEFRLRQHATALEHLNRAERAGLATTPAFVAVVGYHRAILFARLEQFERAFDLDASLVRGGNTTPAMLDAVGIALLRLPLLPDEVPPEKRELVQLAGRAGVFRIGMMKEAADKPSSNSSPAIPTRPTCTTCTARTWRGIIPMKRSSSFRSSSPTRRGMCSPGCRSPRN